MLTIFPLPFPFALLLVDNMTIEDILTPADKQVVIKYALDNIKAGADERHIPGHTAVALYHGQSIFHAAISEELIVNMLVSEEFFIQSSKNSKLAESSFLLQVSGFRCTTKTS